MRKLRSCTKTHNKNQADYIAIIVEKLSRKVAYITSSIQSNQSARVALMKDLFLKHKKGEKMTNAEYRQADGISRSELQLFRKSPKHYEYAKTHPTESTPSLAFGSAAHKYILEKDDFFNEYAIIPNVDRRTKEGKEQYARFLADSEDKELLTLDDYAVITEMAKAIDEHPFARAFLGGEHEVSLFWTDAETGEKVKCRPDVILNDSTVTGKKMIVDYKTTDSLEDGHFERSCKKYGYQLQSGMYREGVFQNYLEDYGFAFVAQEKKAPYCVRVFVCTEQYINEGYDEYRALMGLYHHCKELGKFPSYEGFENEFDYLMGDE